MKPDKKQSVFLRAGVALAAIALGLAFLAYILSYVGGIGQRLTCWRNDKKELLVSQESKEYRRFILEELSRWYASMPGQDKIRVCNTIHNGLQILGIDQEQVECRFSAFEPLVSGGRSRLNFCMVFGRLYQYLTFCFSEICSVVPVWNWYTLRSTVFVFCVEKRCVVTQSVRKSADLLLQSGRKSGYALLFFRRFLRNVWTFPFPFES